MTSILSEMRRLILPDGVLFHLCISAHLPRRSERRGPSHSRV